MSRVDLPTFTSLASLSSVSPAGVPDGPAPQASAGAARWFDALDNTAATTLHAPADGPGMADTPQALTARFLDALLAAPAP